MIHYYKKIKDLYFQLRGLNANINELLWANYFHDYTKNIEELKTLKLSPGRWAANYSLLYILSKLIIELKPLKILELGLGESTKLITTLIQNNSEVKNHLILENDEDWIHHFASCFKLNEKSEILQVTIIDKSIHQKTTTLYNLQNSASYADYTLFLIDGPKGSSHYSRYNICEIAEFFTSENEFIIIVDDAARNGEKEMIDALKNILNNKKIKFYSSIFEGNKSQVVISTEKYKYAVSI
ncbi:MAG: hypothetical protein IPM42_10460 [Saprospiraceae bacterium]|nr:hypothetical protein [Saprospiraceae bacterium]